MGKKRKQRGEEVEERGPFIFKMKECLFPFLKLFINFVYLVFAAIDVRER